MRRRRGSPRSPPYLLLLHPRMQGRPLPQLRSLRSRSQRSGSSGRGFTGSSLLWWRSGSCGLFSASRLTGSTPNARERPLPSCAGFQPASASSVATRGVRTSSTSWSCLVCAGRHRRGDGTCRHNALRHAPTRHQAAFWDPGARRVRAGALNSSAASSDAALGGHRTDVPRCRQAASWQANAPRSCPQADMTIVRQVLSRGWSRAAERVSRPLLQLWHLGSVCNEGEPGHGQLLCPTTFLVILTLLHYITLCTLYVINNT